MMKYTIYKTTNLINGKFYIGCHKTIDPNDDYLGSGKLLRRAIEKYGVDNFKKEVLHVFDNAEEMFAKEAEIVTVDFLSEENTYNLKVGGEGGFDYINDQDQTERNKKNSPFGANFDEERHFSEMRKQIARKNVSSNSKFGIGGANFKGKRHSEESKKLISIAASKCTGQKNSQFGTMWITNGFESKKIKKTDSIPDGWKKGRKLVYDTLL